MVTVKRNIVWSKVALIQFNKAIEYIRLDSDQNAENVKTKIFSNIEELRFNNSDRVRKDKK